MHLLLFGAQETRDTRRWALNMPLQNKLQMKMVQDFILEIQERLI